MSKLSDLFDSISGDKSEDGSLGKYDRGGLAPPPELSRSERGSTKQVRGGVFSTGQRIWTPKGSMGGFHQGESQRALIDLHGAELKNSFYEGADGVHCYGDCVIRNTVCAQVGEDAMTIYGSEVELYDFVVHAIPFDPNDRDKWLKELDKAKGRDNHDKKIDKAIQCNGNKNGQKIVIRQKGGVYYGNPRPFRVNGGKNAHDLKVELWLEDVTYFYNDSVARCTETEGGRHPFITVRATNCDLIGVKDPWQFDKKHGDLKISRNVRIWKS